MTFPRISTTVDELATIRRRLNAHDWYARCFANLRAPVDKLLRHGIRIPKEKGFVFYEICPQDDTRLRQNPFDPADHTCPTCGVNYTDEPYFRAWVTFYQLYVAQRAVDMGIVYQVTRDDAYANAIRYIVTEYARHYEDYPLVDCVLGPTRLFQSTWIESIWLAALATAADLARKTIPADEWRLLRDSLFLPSAKVIMDYDEGADNRQAMNNAAMGLVGILCEDDRLLQHALHGPHGWLHHLEHSVLADGLWYEGNNYHFATLPAMANLAEAVSRNGEDLFQVEVGSRRFKMMFDAPIAPLYPDLTFPARKDSQFGITVAQRWHAGMYELGYGRYGDPAYARLLREMYGRAGDEQARLGWASGLIDVADPHRADRERLDWRGFLNAVPELDAEAAMPATTSVNMPGTGLGILRRDGGRTYAAIDYGHYGGGHGHPDRMQLHFYARGKRWCVDWGTGAYFFEHLRWYRSSIAHNTVVVDGKNQLAVDGTWRRFGVTPAAQVIAAAVDEVYPGVDFRRTAVLLSPDLLLDLFVVDADQEHQLDWALHPHGKVELAGTDTPSAPAKLHGENYEWLHHVRRAPASDTWLALFRHEANALALHMLSAAGTEVYTGAAYGPPPEIPILSPVLVARRTASQTTFAALFEHRSGERAVVRSFRSSSDGGYGVSLLDGSRYACRYDDGTAAVSVTRYRPDGTLAEVSGFGVSEVPGAFVADFPLEQVFLRIDGETAHLTVPERFGRVRVLASGPAKIAVNGTPAVPLDAAGVRQRPDVWSRLSTDRLWIGVPNAVDLTLYNYGNAPLRGDLDLTLPARWSQAAPVRQVAPLASSIYRLQCIPGHEQATVRVGLTGDSFHLTSIPPIEVEAWFPNLSGAILRVRIANSSDQPRPVRVSVGQQSHLVEVQRVSMLDVPVDWRKMASPLAVRTTCGEYLDTHELRSRIAFVGRDYDLAEAEQVRRGERHWRGPNDLSARFRLDRDGDTLKLQIAVKDDVLKCSGVADKHFDYDSVQVYFDPRSDQDRTNADPTGTYGLVLVPESPDGELPRIFPIGPVELTQVSSEMTLPSLDGVTLGSSLRPDGYDLELVLPLARLGCDPQPGDKLGFDLIVNDNDGTFRRSLQMIWTGAGDSRIWLQQDYHAPQHYGVLVF